MSRKGNPHDNDMAENFFSIPKTECIYRHKLDTFYEANEMIDRYIHFYNYERIQLKTGVGFLAVLAGKFSNRTERRPHRTLEPTVKNSKAF